MFVGANKGRLKKLLEIKEVLIKNEIKYKFIVISGNKKYKELYNDITFFSKPIKYETILTEISNTDCILDIVQEGQTGLTWRPFEALFFNKKLITTNKLIVEFDFYNKNNILVLDNNYDEIVPFLKLPYVKIDEKIKERYKLEYWIANFFND